MGATSREALIIGCGIAGPVVAMALQRVGIGAVIYEAHSTPADHVGAFLNLSPNGLNALETLGLGVVVREVSLPCTHMSFRNASGKRIGEMDMGSEARGHGATSVVIKRGLLHGVLREEAIRRGIRVEFGKRLRAFEPSSTGGVAASFEDGTTAHGELLVGCDGIHSRTRQLLLPDAPAPAYTGLIGLGGFTRIQIPLRATPEMHMTFGRRAFFGYFVAPSGEIYWFSNVEHSQEPTRAELAALARDGWRQQLLALHGEDPAPIPEILRSLEGELGCYPIHDLPFLPTWHEGPVCLIGDAAHATSPHAGQGASMAIEDAIVLARCLRDVPDLEQAFATFQGLRKQRVERLILEARRTGSQKVVTNPVGLWLRDRLMPLFLKLGARSLDRVHSYRVNWDERVA